MSKPPTIVTAYAQRCNGPGWYNQLVCVISRDENQTLVETYIQPHEMTGEIAMLFGVSEAAHLAMVAAVNQKNARQTKRKVKA